MRMRRGEGRGWEGMGGDSETPPLRPQALFSPPPPDLSCGPRRGGASTAGFARFVVLDSITLWERCTTRRDRDLAVLEDPDCAEDALGGHIGSLEGRFITSPVDLSRARLRLSSKAAWLKIERPLTEYPRDSTGGALR